MNTPSVRLFVAFEVPRGHREAVAERIRRHEELFPGARWTDVGGQHVTLRFIGWVQERQVPEVAAICNEVASTATSSELSLDSLGIFPGPRRARVLWMGIRDPSRSSVDLADDLDACLGTAGFEGEKRDFTAHLTLARFKVPLRVDNLPDIETADLPPFQLDRIVLYRSHLGSGGPRYEEIETFPLGSV